MTKKNAKPATKSDIRLLKADVRFVKADLRFVKTDLRSLAQSLRKEIKDSGKAIVKELKHYFDLKVETLKYDYDGIFNDRTEQHSDTLRDHERRLVTVERHLGVF